MILHLVLHRFLMAFYQVWLCYDSSTCFLTCLTMFLLYLFYFFFFMCFLTVSTQPHAQSCTVLHSSPQSCTVCLLMHSLLRCSVVQARAQGPKPAGPSPSRQSCHQGFTGPRAWALIFGSLRPRLQALGMYTDKISIIFSVEGFKKNFNHAISLISANISEYFTKQL